MSLKIKGERRTWQCGFQALPNPNSWEITWDAWQTQKAAGFALCPHWATSRVPCMTWGVPEIFWTAKEKLFISSTNCGDLSLLEPSGAGPIPIPFCRWGLWAWEGPVLPREHWEDPSPGWSQRGLMGTKQAAREHGAWRPRYTTGANYTFACFLSQGSPTSNI